MIRVSISDKEAVEINSLLTEIISQYESSDDPNFLRQSSVIAHELPRRLRVALNDFKQLELPSGACLISSFPVDDLKIGRTPSHWKLRSEHTQTIKEEMLFILVGSLLGDFIGWATQQNGYIIHDVLPIREDENSQISTGSQQTIWWHNEDAFHPYRGDYVGLMCLRNPDNIPTTMACIDMLELHPDIVKILFEYRFVIRPDESHNQKNGSDASACPGRCDTSLKSAYQNIERMQNNPKKQPVLFGDPQSPYLRLDPYFMDPLEDDEAQFALNALIREIDKKLTDVVLRPGDILFLDNYRAVHGRKPFKARYDGTDRWLKRGNITRDLRKSRDARSNCASRIIY